MQSQSLHHRYLAGVPQLDDALLERLENRDCPEWEQARASQLIARLARLIRERRELWVQSLVAAAERLKPT